MLHDDSSLNDAGLIESGLQVLKHHAARGETLSLDDLHRKLGEPFDTGVPERMDRLCEGINAQHSTGTSLKLMISVLVRDDQTGLPGDGFFKLADRLGRLPWTDDAAARVAFVDEQERRVFMVYREAKAPVSGFAPYR
ncbi:hypothetical protein [Glycomyces sp. NRRL B-16210]|uniref:hypothetical protein n=1 Tax=Glycomyces sp. NRRL B-16210 TaxID=1463821 RepID=UPI0004C1AC3E|nr:hypothetical protein [Glycomyces sp. NRRL B-16210]